MITMKSIAALFLGALVGTAMYWVIAVVAVLGMHGLPLGGEGGPPTRADLAVHLAGAIIASGAAGVVVERLAPVRPMALVVVLAFGLALPACFGFSKPASQWPGWYGVAFALAVLAGAIAGGLLSRRKRPKTGVNANP